MRTQLDFSISSPCWRGSLAGLMLLINSHNAFAPNPYHPSNFPFSMVAPPNTELDWATMAIVPTNPQTTLREAKQIALFASEQIKKVKPWKVMHIYIFSNTKAAQTFADYQNPRRGRPLSWTDYAKLTKIWPQVLVRYEYYRGKNVARWRQPSKNPSGWWREGQARLRTQPKARLRRSSKRKTG